MLFVSPGSILKMNGGQVDSVDGSEANNSYGAEAAAA